mgnify:CR=1 FL=1
MKTICLIFSLDHDDKWFDLLDSLVKKMKDRKDCVDYLNQIREFLMRIIFPDLPPVDPSEFENDLLINNSQILSPPENVGRAKSSLLNMISYGASELTFLKLVSLLNSDNVDTKAHFIQ